jgi:hypothetical protein
VCGGGGGWGLCRGDTCSSKSLVPAFLLPLFSVDFKIAPLPTSPVSCMSDNLSVEKNFSFQYHYQKLEDDFHWLSFDQMLPFEPIIVHLRLELSN